MHLYEITMTHYAPRGSGSGIVGYLYAKDDSEVFDKLLALGMLDVKCESVFIEDGGDSDGYEEFAYHLREKIIEDKSDYNEYWGDWHYGHTEHSWSVKVENFDINHENSLVRASFETYVTVLRALDLLIE